MLLPRMCVALLYAFAFAGPAVSAPEFICTQYAQTAVAVQQQNLANGCGLAGDRWSLNFVTNPGA